MDEQTRQQIAADLEYATGQVYRVQCGHSKGEPDRDYADRAMDALERIRGYLQRGDRPQQAGCEHEWHLYGTVNGREDWGCQICGARR